MTARATVRHCLKDMGSEMSYSAEQLTALSFTQSCASVNIVKQIRHVHLWDTRMVWADLICHFVVGKCICQLLCVGL